MTPLAHLDVWDEGKIAVGRIVGEIDISNADSLGGQLLAAIPNEAVGLVLDLSRTTYLDSAGARLLIDVSTRLRSRQQGFRVVVPESSPVRRILTLANLDATIPLDTTLGQALQQTRAASLREPPGPARNR